MLARTLLSLALGVLILGAAVPSVAHALTRAQADRVALAALRPSSLARPVVVYGLPQPLGGSQQVFLEGVPPPRGRAGLKPAGRQWLFFEDLVPGAFFDHPGRLLFVSDSSGRVSSRIATESFPMLGGRAPFIEPGVPRRYVVFARPADAALVAAARPSPAFMRSQLAARSVLPGGWTTGECVLTVGDHGPDQKNFGLDIKAVADTARAVGIPVYPLPDRPDGAAPDGTDLPGFAGALAKKGCKDILIYLAGHGFVTGTPRVAVSAEAEPNGSSLNGFVTAGNLRDTLHFNSGTTFKIIIESCYSGRFIKPLPASFKNLLVLSVSSAADEQSYSGSTQAVVDPTTGEEVNIKGAGPTALSPFVQNFLAGWLNFANSASDVAAAGATGGSLFAYMIADGKALGGSLDIPANVGATHPRTLLLNLATPAPSSPPPTPPPTLPPPTPPPPTQPLGSNTTLDCPATAVLDGSEGIEDEGSVSTPDPMGIPSVTVTVTFTEPDQTPVSKTATTDAAGDYTVAVPASQMGTWTSVATFAGDSQYSSSSSGACTTYVG
jgi:hypothetical protein